jgi:squalene synthase HpnC
MHETRADPAPADFGRPDFLALAREHYENFPVGSVLVPKRLRADVHRVYAFARTADDLADELRDPVAFAAFRAAFRAHLQGRATERVPLFQDLVATIGAHELPVELFEALLDAFEQDLHVRRYDEAGLFHYCARSADPVGRIVLRLFGHREEELDRLSDRICTGLQLLNHLQDVRSDLVERDRIYLPGEDLVRFGVDESALRAEHASPAVRALVRYWLDRTAELLRDGWPLTAHVGGRLRLELRAIVSGAAAVVAAIRRADFDVLGRQLRLSPVQRLAALAGALGRSVPRSLR